MKLIPVLFLLAVAAAGCDAALLPGHPGDVMCFLWSMKYNYCFPILKSDENRDMASKQESCAAKNPGGGPDSWKTQTECCKAHGQCGYSGGPSGRECWAPDFAAKRCVKKRLDDPTVNCSSGLAGGFQYEGICVSESFEGGAAIQGKMAPMGGDKMAPMMQDKMAPAQMQQDKMAPVAKPQDKMAPAQMQQDKMAPPMMQQDKMAPPMMQDKMAPRPGQQGPQVIEIKYTGKGNADVGGDVDIPSGGNPFTKVCGGVTRIIVACNQTKGCAAFTLETKDIQNPGACGYLKRAGGKLSARQAWTVFVRS